MSWFLGVVGFIAGLIIGVLNNALMSSAMLGGLFGVVIGRLLQSNPLDERVRLLEQKVAALKQGLEQLRGKAGMAAAAAAFTTTEQEEQQQASPPPLDAGLRWTPTASIAVAFPEPVEPAAPESVEPATPESVEPAAASAVEMDSTEPEAADAVEVDRPAAAVAPSMPDGGERLDLPPPMPPMPREPSVFDRLFKAARDWLLGGNTVVRVGIVVLFFGVAFLLKYAADNSMFPIELRLAGVALGATALLVIGWRIGDARGAYGLVLQGGGVGVLYLTVFAATKLYDLLPSSTAFPLMVAICALSAFLAVRQNASSLAFMGSAGGFLAPILLASGGGSHVALFSYYALLNAGILAIAWFKAWRPLNLLGFVFTFTIGAAWGATAYRPEFLVSVEPFLILFFLMYVGIALLYALRREIALKNYVDGTLVFGTPIVTIGLQAALMKNIEFGLAWSAVALAAFYLGIATLLVRHRKRLGLMFDAMLALAVIFATLAVPFAFTGLTTSAAWAVEGAAIVWLGIRQRRLVSLGFGLLMQVAAAVAFVTGIWIHPETSHLPVLNSTHIATLMLAVAGLFTGWWLHGREQARAWHPLLPRAGLVMAAWGLLWWIDGGFRQILLFSQQYDWGLRLRFVLNAVTLFAVLTAVLAHLARRRLAWPLAEWPALALPPTIALLATFSLALGEAPLTGLGWVAWPVAAMLGYVLLLRQQDNTRQKVLAPLHTLMFWTICGLLTLEGCWRLNAYVSGWGWNAWAYGFGLQLLLVSGPGARLRWPIARFSHAYLVWGAAPLAALLWAWSIASLQQRGDAWPLIWLPVINPLDVAQLLVFMAFAIWLRQLSALGVQWRRAAFDYIALATVFLWFNALLLRTLHHHFHADYDIAAVLTSFSFQQVFLVGWSTFAFGAMWLVRREGIARMCAIASTPLILMMWVWTLYANFTQDGGSWARLPVFNPLDLVQIVIYAVAALWLVRVNRLGIPLARYLADCRMPLQIAAGATGFLWLNAMLLRTLHHWTNVPYTFDALSRSTLAQASVSVFWTACAFAAMGWATRRAIRPYWLIGAGLLALTVVKLFVFDLSHVTGVERIVSFIGIGIMLLLIGYFSPLPPKAKEIAEGNP